MIGDWKESTIYRAPTRRQDSLRAAIGWVCSRTEKRRQATALQKNRLPAESETADRRARVFWRAPSGARTRYRVPTPAHRTTRANFVLKKFKKAKTEEPCGYRRRYGKRFLIFTSMPKVPL